MATRTCGFVFTTTGRPCAEPRGRRAPVVPGRATRSRRRRGVPKTAAPPRRPGSVTQSSGRAAARAPATGSRTRRATELIRQAMASEDADEIGLRAESVLADATTALALLGGPDASPAAVPRWSSDSGESVRCSSSVTRSGGALIISFHLTSMEPRSDPRAPTRTSSAWSRTSPASTRGLYGLLCVIDEDEGFAGDALRDRCASMAARHLHGGGPRRHAGAHRDYVRTLDRVMRLVRPLVASRGAASEPVRRSPLRRLRCRSEEIR